MIKKSAKKQLKVALILFLLILTPLIASQFNDFLASRGKAANETVNRLPLVTEFPLESTQSGGNYSTNIRAIDDDGDSVSYFLQCPDNIENIECKNPNNPDNLKIDTKTGEITWDTPTIETTQSSDITIYISDGKDFSKYTYTLTIEYSSVYVRQFISIPSSGKVNPGQVIEFRAVLESISGIEKVIATFYDDDIELKSLEWSFGNPVKKIMIDSNSDPAFVFKVEEDETIYVDLEIETVDGSVSNYNRVYSLFVSQTEASSSLTISGSGNVAPLFHTDTNPYSSNVLDEGTSYHFVLKAHDNENDSISSSITAKPDWLNITEATSTEDGKTIVSFICNGTPMTEGPYMVAITINDGLHNHFATRVWPVVVQNPDGNDIPVINILAPTTAVNVFSNGAVTFKWEGTDRNQLEKFVFYYSKTPTDRGSWTKIKELDYNYIEFSWVSHLPEGTYYVIIETNDNQTPSLSGYAVSVPINVLPIPPQDNDEGNNGNDNDTNRSNNGNNDTDNPSLTPPTIQNIYPQNGSQVKTPLTISADLYAGNDKELDLPSVKLFLDNNDISDQLTLNSTQKSRASVSYTVESLSDGEHEVIFSFNNNNDEKVVKSITFTFQKASSISENNDDDNNTDKSKSLITKLTKFVDNIPDFLRWILLAGLIMVILGIILLFSVSGLQKKDGATDYYNNFSADPSPKGPYSSGSSKPITEPLGSSLIKENPQTQPSAILTNEVSTPSDTNSVSVGNDVTTNSMDTQRAIDPYPKSVDHLNLGHTAPVTTPPINNVPPQTTTNTTVHTNLSAETKQNKQLEDNTDQGNHISPPPVETDISGNISDTQGSIELSPRDSSLQVPPKIKK